MTEAVYVFDYDSMVWLKKNDFTDSQIDELASIMGRIAKHVENTYNSGKPPHLS